MPALVNNTPSRGADQEEVARTLSAQQDLYKLQSEVRNTLRQAEGVNPPSILKYLALFSIAGVVDLADIVDYTGLLLIISRVISIIGTALLLFILWLTNTNIKKAKELPQQLEARVATWEKRLNRISNLAQGTSKRLRNSAGFSRLTRRAPRSIQKIFVSKGSPTKKVLWGGLLNVVPFLSALNLYIFWIYLAYRDEKKAYQEAQNSASLTLSQMAQAIKSVNIEDIYSQ